MGHGTYGSGKYAVCVETVGPFGVEESHTQWFDTAAEAMAYFTEQSEQDGTVRGTCPVKTRRTRMNRAVREARDKDGES